uniref:Lipoprotein n=1 Tax=Streptomyces pratensis (strain ATCC 33331 / IAF-45CD) TaxID=591167 RepID=A0A8D3WLE0_STRFA
MRAGLALLTACAALAGCGGGADRDDRPAKPPTASGTLEQLASKADCDPRLQTDAEELRQANCTTEEGRYVLATFATDRGQREWINEANDYGGSYLVGRKWVAVGDPEVVAALRGRLGGTVETASPHHSGNSGGGGSEEGHSGHHGS